MKEKMYKKINELHPGWIEHEESERKTHYFIKEDCDWYISICGEIIPDRDLLNRFEEHYQCSDTINNFCRHCLKKYRKLQDGKSITIRLKSILV